MISHTAMWRAIDNFASSHNMTCSALARLSGLDATTFNKSKRWAGGKPRWPSTQSLAKIIHATNATVEEFVACIPKE